MCEVYFQNEFKLQQFRTHLNVTLRYGTKYCILTLYEGFKTNNAELN